MAADVEHRTLDELSRAAFTLLLKEPFYAHVLAGIPREVSDGVRTTGAAWDGQQVRLRVNPVHFLKKLTPAQRVGVLKHETLHVSFRHVFRGTERNPRLFSIAADVVVNQLIGPYPLPASYPRLADFPDLGLAADRTVDEYYAAFVKLFRQMQRDGYCSPQSGDGADKSCSGPSAPDWASGTASPKSAAALARFLEDEQGRGDDSGWLDGNDGITAAGCYAVGNLILRARERMPPHQWTTLPAALVSQLDFILAERQPKIDWKRLVRIFCASAGRTRIRHTLKRISKRYGTRPGIKVQRLQRLLVAVDTSGSIDQGLLNDFFAEIHGVWKAGATVVVVECDAAVQQSYEYRGKPPTAVNGGGGTEFEPVFQWMREQRPFDGVIYLTDGYGPAPQTRPNCKLLWVITDGGSQEIFPFGPTVRIPALKE